MVQLNKRQLYRNLVRVVLPIAIQYLISGSLSLVDNLMVGKLGEVALASVNAGSQMFSIVWGILFGFCSASSAFMSQFWGNSDLKNIRRVIGFCGTICFASGALVTVLSLLFPETLVGLFTDIPEAIAGGMNYLRIIAPTFILYPLSATLQSGLRATQQTKIPLYISLLTFSTNTCLNYIFIFGKLGLPAMGVEGAALATLIARILELTLSLFAVFGGKNILKGPVSGFFGFGRDLAKRIIVTGLPVMANESLWSIGQSVISAMFGRTSLAEYSAFIAAIAVENMFIMVAFSMGDAVMILVGQKLGEGEPEEAYEMARVLNRIGVLIGLVMSVLMYLCSPAILTLYNLTPEGLILTRKIIIVFAFGMSIQLGSALIIVGALRCGGDTKAAFFIEIGTLWGISIVLVWLGIFVLKLPVYWVCVLYLSGHLVKYFLARRRFRTRKWCRTIIRGL